MVVGPVQQILQSPGAPADFFIKQLHRQLQARSARANNVHVHVHASSTLPEERRVDDHPTADNTREAIFVRHTRQLHALFIYLPSDDRPPTPFPSLWSSVLNVSCLSPRRIEKPHDEFSFVRPTSYRREKRSKRSLRRQKRHSRNWTEAIGLFCALIALLDVGYRSGSGIESPFMSSIYIYAELLLHIRQVAVLAILPSPANPSTHIGISADSKTLSLEHEGQRAIAELPCPVLGIANRREDTSQQELSFRLQPSAAARLPTPGRLPAGDVPWSASTLSPNMQIACKGCKRLLVRPVQTWKDLPSGGWAEMMELWHCHKPNVPGSSDHSSTSSIKGYGASNTIGPSPGTALVDIGHFVLADEDCIGLQVRSGRSNKPGFAA